MVYYANELESSRELTGWSARLVVFWPDLGWNDANGSQANLVAVLYAADAGLGLTAGFVCGWWWLQTSYKLASTRLVRLMKVVASME